MPTMTVFPLNRAVPVTDGQTVLQALVAGGFKVTPECGGEAKCGGCHIFVIEGRKGLSKIQRLENEKLDGLVGVGSKSRLACQARVGSEDFSIELLGFSSGG